MTAEYSLCFIIPEAWIIGDSIVKKAETYACSMGCLNLRQTKYKMVWLGQSGMHWTQLLPALQYQMISRGQPEIIIIHLGGNDIDAIPQNKFIKLIKNDIQYVQSVFSSTTLIWCDILPRLAWRNNRHDSPKVLNLKRKRINRAAHQYITKLPLGRVVSPRIEWYMEELFHADGVHLSDFGNMTYIQTLQNLVHKIIEGK